MKRLANNICFFSLKVLLLFENRKSSKYDMNGKLQKYYWNSLDHYLNLIWRLLCISLFYNGLCYSQNISHYYMLYKLIGKKKTKTWMKNRVNWRSISRENQVSSWRGSWQCEQCLWCQRERVRRCLSPPSTSIPEHHLL